VRLYRPDGQMKHFCHLTICKAFLSQLQNFHFAGRKYFKRFRVGFTVGWLVGWLSAFFLPMMKMKV
jgi:hypothetical protein